MSLVRSSQRCLYLEWCFKWKCQQMNPLNVCGEKLVEQFYGRNICTNWKNSYNEWKLEYQRCCHMRCAMWKVKIVSSANSYNIFFSPHVNTFEFNSSFVISVVILTCSPAFFSLSYFGCQLKDFHHKLTQFWVLFEKIKLNQDENRKTLHTLW